MSSSYLISEHIQEILENASFCLLGIIRAVYPERMRADVEIKLQRRVGQGDRQRLVPAPIVLECPIAHWKNPCLVERKLPRPGDPCIVVFHDRALDELIRDLEKRDPEHKRMHHINDGIVIGSWIYDTEHPKIPSYIGRCGPFDFLLALHRQKLNRIYLDCETGFIVLHVQAGDKVEVGSENADMNLILAPPVTLKYNVHTHAAMPGPGCGPPWPQWDPRTDWSWCAYTRNWPVGTTATHAEPPLPC